MQILPVIMAGGSGTRLWPLSRSQYPKQFLRLGSSDKTLLQETLLRARTVCDEPPLIICNEEHRFVAAEQARQINLKARILLEPEGRNTAPTIALAALHAIQQGKDPLLLVLPADHTITDPDALRNAVSKAKPLASQGMMVALGIEAKSPETGYGYIEKGAKIQHESCFKVTRFLEKPDRDTASKLIENGNHLWNSGIFVLRSSIYLKELQLHAPEVLDACTESMKEVHQDMEFERLQQEAFLRCPSISIDHAVMEKTDNAATVELYTKWSDLGTWNSLLENGSLNEHGNLLLGDTLAMDCSNSYFHSTGRLIAASGVDNIIAVETKDAVLIAHRDHDQSIKKLVTRLKELNRKEEREHPKSFRPWGYFESIDQGKRYKVKRITVKSGASLSLQLHHHRAEHWIVVSGTARVTIGNKTFLLSENESTFIPVGKSHRLENPGKMDLELIEVQSGSYLDEDDIVRLGDVYGR
tara:strand:- start:4796 stop:6205 length:1410 start_codon:yes stop_codon:yes gene_type:complete